MSKVRVLRLLEYVYDDVESMEADMTHWQVAVVGIYKPNSKLIIRSSTLPLEVLTDDDTTT